ncbi:MAG: type II toxin-antitoxin system VapC family toxin [Cyanobacteria bacterium P01_C01_bin.120]
MSKVVLDASALLAYLYEETGADVVESAISMDSLISMVNWSEVLSKVSMNGGRIDDLVSKMSQKEFGKLTIASMPEADAIQIGKLYPKTKSLGLSLGDRACLALGMRLESTILTADTVWKNLNLGIQIVIIR